VLHSFSLQCSVCLLSGDACSFGVCHSAALRATKVGYQTAHVQC
jgi:hypothetical protein